MSMMYGIFLLYYRYITVTGRVDDVITVAGHRMSAGAIERALLRHQSISEAGITL